MRIISLLLLLAASALAGTADEDWKAVTTLDAGPGIEPKSSADARKIALDHLDKQEAALRDFLAGHGGDSRAVEARLRLVRLLNLRADMTETATPEEAAKLLDEAKAAASTPEQKTELDFAMLKKEMRAARGKRPGPDERRALLESARAFKKAHPKDPRIPALLVELANQFEAEPPTKHALLNEARLLTEDQALLRQITDDKKRLAFLGKKLPLRFTALDGRRHTVDDWAGQTVVILFFATWSKPSLAVFKEIEEAAKRTGSVFVAISLDFDLAPLERFMREQKTRAIVAWDGKSWDSPLLVALGLNAIPAAWVLDPGGILRSLDAFDDPAGILAKYQR